MAARAALRRVTAARNRLLAARARSDSRAWQVKRRERTRQLIELGGLVSKAGLIELTDDDRAVMFGLFVEAAAALRDERRDNALTLWRRRGKRAFQAEADGEAASIEPVPPSFA
ncbi:conjugal transfer protein TraD [Sphingomonas sp.]|uniref:conjugal transfer protein TraD n=1 Tax=Sphingomonas sp. TaxID=28214 RepID=UPI0025FE1719|nr:conjugal transfer protein TraD [Sphingomonas sp.]